MNQNGRRKRRNKTELAGQPGCSLVPSLDRGPEDGAAVAAGVGAEAGEGAVAEAGV